MKLKPFNRFNSKTCLFSVSVLILLSTLSLNAYSQIDHFYGLNTQGVRVSIGVGAPILNSNWSSNPVGYEGLAALDYDLNQYFSVGLQGQFGQLTGKDLRGKLYYSKSVNSYAGGNLNFKLALGQFVTFTAKNRFQDAVKRIYIGTGIGVINSDVTLTDHSYDNYANTVQKGDLKTIETPMKATSDPSKTKGSGTAAYVPVSIGTNIALRGLLGYDKLELNPNFQYNFVQSKVFDGYQPNSVTKPYIPVNGDQSFYTISLSLKYKF